MRELTRSAAEPLRHKHDSAVARLRGRGVRVGHCRDGVR